MRRLLMLLALLALPCMAHAVQEEGFDRFLANFDYETRAEMKTDSKQLLNLLEVNQAVLVDIRFPEEVAAWKMGFGKFIPLNELPKRYHELPKDKIIVTACPHKDRSSIAMAFLRSKGYTARYLTDGLIGLAERLRGDVAKDLLEDAGLTSTEKP